MHTVAFFPLQKYPEFIVKTILTRKATECGLSHIRQKERLFVLRSVAIIELDNLSAHAAGKRKKTNNKCQFQ
jgi:hypothetical protein